MMCRMSIRRTSGRTVYENAWMVVREDQTELADGTAGIYGVVEKPDFALIIPEDVDGALWLVEQYRYPVSGRYWEFPQGTRGRDHTVAPEELARGELREETGFSAGRLEHIGHLFQAYGFSSQGLNVWHATDLTPGEVEREPSEQDMRHDRFSRAEFERMLQDGTIMDASTIAAYGLLLVAERNRRAPEMPPRADDLPRH